MVWTGDCISCQYGDHSGHQEVIQAVSAGVLGGAKCSCTGDCVERNGYLTVPRGTGSVPESVVMAALKSVEPHTWALVADEDPLEHEVCVLCGAQRNKEGPIAEPATITGGWPMGVFNCEEHPLLARRIAWERAHPRPEQLRRVERAIVVALNEAEFGDQSQVTREDGFDIAVDDLIIHVEYRP